jgi:hypothetical protein
MSTETKRRFLKEEYYGWRASESMAIQYIDVCKHALLNEDLFDNFRRYPQYMTILEHVPETLGKAYLDDVKEKNENLLNDIDSFVKANDKIGNPIKVSYPNYSNLSMSPTTARYIKVFSDLENLFGSLEGMNIVEIGGGYGGLATVIGAKYGFSNYYNVDLLFPCKLSKKYCNANNVQNFSIVTPEKVEKTFADKPIDLVISNYAFSECNLETQDFYIKNILDKSKRGYITHNTGQDRIERSKSVFEKYENFLVYGSDLCRKKHPILAWGPKEVSNEG